jgi:hypothetical protein
MRIRDVLFTVYCICHQMGLLLNLNNRVEFQEWRENGHFNHKLQLTVMLRDVNVNFSCYLDDLFKILTRKMGKAVLGA